MKTGDLVKLKSGGPVMTVSRVYKGQPFNFVTCQWFDYLGVHHIENMPPEILANASKAKAGRK